MTKNHTYALKTRWGGAEGKPARTYRGYSRDHVIEIEGKPDLLGSADPAFLGNSQRHNPEDLLLASLSSCHMLWYLHLCVVNGITVHAYEDAATGRMEETADGAGSFVEVTLCPRVQISPAGKKDLAMALHGEAQKKCFIANSVNFPVRHKADIRIVD